VGLATPFWCAAMSQGQPQPLCTLRELRWLVSGRAGGPRTQVLVTRSKPLLVRFCGAQVDGRGAVYLLPVRTLLWGMGWYRHAFGHWELVVNLGRRPVLWSA